MKLLVVASTFPAHDADPVPAFVRDQLIALKELDAGLKISVLAPHDRRSGTVDDKRWPAYDERRFHYFWPHSAERLAGRGILPALQANPLNYLLIPWLFLGELRALLSMTRAIRPDVIYAHWFTPQAVVAACVGHITGTPFVFTTHSSDVQVWGRLPWFGRYVVRACARRARAFTAVSRRSMAKLEAFFEAPEWLAISRRAAIIPMGVTLPAEVPREVVRQAHRTVILFLGRLVEKKGVQHLLPAYAAARADLGDSELVIAGDGPLQRALETQVATLGLTACVRFTGFVSGEQKTRLFDEADLFVVPSIVTASGDAEGLPVALLEGLASGRVCIATDASGADDILTHGRDGWLVPERDPGALAAALIEAAGLDATRRAAMESAARATAAKFSWPAIARQYHEFLFGPDATV